MKDIATYCMVSRTTVRRWIETGKLGAIRLPSGHYRINRVDYRSFLETCEYPLKDGTFKSKSKRKEKT